MAQMDLTTGPGLVAAIAKTLDREDLNDNISAWVRMAEAAINRDLRTYQMIKRKSTDTDEQFVTLPPGFVGLKNIQIGNNKLTYLSPEDLDNVRRDTIAGLPCSPHYYTIIGTTIELAPAPTSEITLEMVFYEAVPALDLTTPGATNWLLQKAPGIYLYGALMHSAPYLREDERVSLWTSLAANELASLNSESERVEHGGGRINIKLRTGY